MDQDIFIFSFSQYLNIVQLNYKNNKKYNSKTPIFPTPKVKKELWGGSFWDGRFFVSSCGKNTSEKIIKEYVRNKDKQDSYK